ncbi:hypothetical protein QBC34DRAFT_77485 [Podospora aff. communis PSN243]|uniref:Uncharacterized protein n=1 Tax=Podospora aff. communis PSN243 TaxID=3040156 RepID=A0AAV9GNM5_9PEZI|nr:hypothetical protein QBC34DRAFT_77485 [Podospora aff. communis PSN243]
MSVYDIFFVFGKPGSYVLDCPKRCVRHNIPSSLNAHLSEFPVTQILSLALDCNDNYFVCTKYQYGGSKSRWFISGGAQRAYPTLQKFINESKAAGRDITNFRVTFGSQGNDFVACNSATGAWRSWNASPGLNAQMQKAFATKHVRVLAMGMNGAFAILYTDATFWFACSNNYPTLARLLQNTRRGDLVFVAMNPYRGDEYFVVFANGQVHIKASAVLERDVETILGDYPNLEVITSTVVKRNTEVSNTSGLPPQARRKEFLKAIGASVGNGIVGAGISAIFGACTVM